MSDKLELCSQCNEPTGHAGAGEDSIFIDTNGNPIGPLCDKCLDAIRKWVKDDCDCLLDQALAKRDRRIVELEQENATLRNALSFASAEITNMEINLKNGGPGFSCDVIDHIDAALNPPSRPEAEAAEGEPKP